MSIGHIYTNQILELLHMDLIGPFQVDNIGGKRYTLVVLDEFSRFTWVIFLRHKSDATEKVVGLFSRLQCETGEAIIAVCSDNEREFVNKDLINYFWEEAIDYQYSSPITPQQTGVAKRKNRSILDMGKTLLHAKKVAFHFWPDALNTICYILNLVTLQKRTNKMSFELG